MARWRAAVSLALPSPRAPWSRTFCVDAAQAASGRPRSHGSARTPAPCRTARRESLTLSIIARAVPSPKNGGGPHHDAVELDDAAGRLVAREREEAGQLEAGGLVVRDGFRHPRHARVARDGGDLRLPAHHALGPAAQAGEDLEVIALGVHLQEAARGRAVAPELVQHVLEPADRDALVARHLGSPAETLGGEGGRRPERREHVV